MKTSRYWCVVKKVVFAASFAALLAARAACALEQPDLHFRSSDTIADLERKIAANGFSFKVKPNWVFNMSAAQKREFFNGRRPSAAQAQIAPLSSTRMSFPRMALPSSFDLRNINGKAYIGAVRDQGAIGSCYAFAAAGLAEAVYNFRLGKAGAHTKDFSESYIAWSLGSLSPYNAHFSGGDGADYDYYELFALTLPGAATGKEGICDESDFPYVEVRPSPQTITQSFTYPRVAFDSWHRVYPSNYALTTDEIKAAIYTYGAVDAAVYASSAFDAYDSGVYEDTNTAPTQTPYYYDRTNHAIVLVGWDDAPPEGGGGVWILRNSWGSSWGENGYMRIRYFSAQVNSAAAFVTYADDLPQINAAAAGAITSTRAVVSAEIHPHSGDTRYWIDYGVMDSYGSSSASGTVSMAQGETAISVPLSGLTAGTTYHWRVVAKNSYGTITSEDQLFVTAGSSAPSAAAAAPALVTPTSALLRGTVSANGAATQYVFRYRIASQPESQTAQASLSEDAVVAAVSAEVSGLLPGQRYSYTCVAVNAKGTTESAAQIFTTPQPLVQGDFAAAVPPAGWSQTTVATAAGEAPAWRQSGEAAAFNAASAGAGGEARLISPVVDLRGRTAPALSFSVRHDLLESKGDYVQLQASTDGVTWSDVEEEVRRYDGVHDGWVRHLFDLSSYVGARQFQIALLGHSAAGADVLVKEAVLAVEGPAWHISGSIRGVPGEAAVLIVGGAGGATAQPESDGSFLISGLEDGEYQILPAAPGYVFTPPTARVVVRGADVDGLLFAAVPLIAKPFPILPKRHMKVGIRKERKRPLSPKFSCRAPGRGKVTCYWDFNGDESVDAVGNSVRYTFAAPGRYAVKVMVKAGRYGWTRTRVFRIRRGLNTAQAR